MYYVNVYLVDRAYGGPEEGSWYYDTGKLISSTERQHEQGAENLRQIQQVWCDEENKNRRSDISSVLSEGRYVVYIEEESGADFPKTRPYYE